MLDSFNYIIIVVFKCWFYSNFNKLYGNTMTYNYIYNGVRAEAGEFPFFCALCLSDSTDIT